MQRIINHTYKMGVIKQISIKNRTYYFYNDIIDLENFKSILLKIDKKSHKDIGIYNIEYITIKKKLMIVKIFTIWILCICVLIMQAKLHSTNENKELLKKYSNVFDGIRDKTKEINSDKCDYEKGYMKIKFNSYDDSPLNKPLKFHNMTITIRPVFEEDGKIYPHVFLDDTLYELNILKC